MLPHWQDSRRSRTGPLLDALRREAVDVVTHDVLRARSGLSDAGVRQLARRLCERGQLLRMIPGLYRVVGVADAGDGVARAIDWVLGTQPHWLSGRSALAAYDVAPLGDRIVVTCAGEKFPRALGKVWLTFDRMLPRVKPPLQRLAVPGVGTVPVPTPEGLMVEALARPDRFGGLLALAGALGKLQRQLVPAKVVAAALATRQAAVLRRTGFMLDLMGAPRETVAPLRQALQRTLCLLDPKAPMKGAFNLPYWQLVVNVPVAQVQAALASRS